MAGWQPVSPGIWIGEGSQRMFAAQASGQWILQDADGAELRRSRTLLGLVAELGPLDDSGQDAVTPSPRSWSERTRCELKARSSRYGSVISRSDTSAVRSCARCSGPRWSAHSCST